jgi:hypothetical protein
MPATMPAESPLDGAETAAETVYVVTDIYGMFGSERVSAVYSNEISALRAAHQAALPSGVIRRTVAPFEVRS